MSCYLFHCFLTSLEKTTSLWSSWSLWSRMSWTIWLVGIMLCFGTTEANVWWAFTGQWGRRRLNRVSLCLPYGSLTVIQRNMFRDSLLCVSYGQQPLDHWLRLSRNVSINSFHCKYKVWLLNTSWLKNKHYAAWLFSKHGVLIPNPLPTHDSLFIV